MVDMANKMLIPATVKYTKRLADTVIAVKEAGADASVQVEILTEVSAKLSEMKKAAAELEAITAKAADTDSSEESAKAYKNDVMAAMAELRKPADELEVMMPKEVWPMPTYGDMLFTL